MTDGRAAISSISMETAVTLAAAGFFYYLQTATAYMLMEYISPVTYRYGLPRNSDGFDTMTADRVRLC